MAQNKTVPTKADVADFLAGLEDAEQQKDSETLVEIMAKVTGEQPVMWGPSIIGFGYVRITSASGREVDWLRIGFSPRKGKLSLYVTFEAEKYKKMLDEMGKYKTGKGCVYINKLADVDTEKLTAFIDKAYKDNVKLFSK